MIDVRQIVRNRLEDMFRDAIAEKDVENAVNMLIYDQDADAIHAVIVDALHEKLEEIANDEMDDALEAAIEGVIA